MAFEHESNNVVKSSKTPCLSATGALASTTPWALFVCLFVCLFVFSVCLCLFVFLFVWLVGWLVGVSFVVGLGTDWVPKYGRTPEPTA